MPSGAFARGDRTIVPGQFGYNALPPIPNADPVVGDDVLFGLDLAAQVSDPIDPRDAALTPYLRLVLPFRGLAALEIDGVPLELWRVSLDTQQRLGAQAASGVELGDMRFGARFALLPEGEILPALGVRLITKTATGKGFENRRFIDAPAYVIDGLLGKDIPARLGPFTHLRVLGKIGFMAWQQGTDWQDDAVDAGATVQLHAGGTRLELEWRGYWGYEQQDKPHLIGLTVAHAAAGVEWIATVNRGISAEATPWELRLGVVFRLGTPWASPK